MAPKTIDDKATPHFKKLLHEVAAHVFHQFYTCYRNDGLPALRWPEHLTFLAGGDLIDAVDELFKIIEHEEHAIYLTLYYARMLSQINSTFQMDFTSITRFIAIAIMLAQKYLDDCSWGNKVWAHLAGIPLEELNQLELKIFLDKDFSLFIKSDNYDEWLRQLRQYVPLLHAYKCMSEIKRQSAATKIFSTLGYRHPNYSGVSSQSSSPYTSETSVIDSPFNIDSPFIIDDALLMDDNPYWNYDLFMTNNGMIIEDYCLDTEYLSLYSKQVYCAGASSKDLASAQIREIWGSQCTTKAEYNHCGIPMAIPDYLRHVWDVTY
jgi:hypothetical protein